MNIGIDCSIVSTAICLDNNGKYEFYSFSSQKKNAKWIKRISPYINFVPITYKLEKDLPYTELELLKLDTYTNIIDYIVTTIVEASNGEKVENIQIEGLANMSNGNSKNDLTGFTYLLRAAYRKQWPEANFLFITPTELKKYACALAYGWQEIRLKSGKLKGYKTRNSNDLAGGRFQKWEMLQAFIDQKKECSLLDYTLKYKDEIFKMKSIHKPLDDIIDSWFALQTIGATTPHIN